MPRLARHRFDYAALYAALEERRRARAISWAQVAAETGTAPSTVGRTQRGGPMEADGVRALVRWLDLAPEAFVRSDDGRRTPEGLVSPPAPKGRIRRFDTTALHAALDEKRRARGLTWADVAREIGGPLSPAMLTRLAKKRGRISVELMVAASGWVGKSVESLTYESAR